METGLIKQPDTKEMEQNGVAIVEAARRFLIADDNAYQNAGIFLNDVTQKAKNIEAQFKEPVDKAFQAHRAMTALRDKVLSPFKDAKRVISDKIGTYSAEQDRKRREAAAKAAEDARKRAEDERLRQAEAAERSGDKEGVESLLNAPLTPKIDPASIPQAAPKMKGVITRKDWDFEITDPAAIPREYLIPDEQKIRKMVRALGGETSIPGIAVFEKTVVGSRGNA